MNGQVARYDPANPADNEAGLRALLDTNILIHREASVVVREDIGLVFNWLDRVGYDKCVHPLSRQEIERHKDERVRRSFAAKISSYHVLKTIAPMAAQVEALSPFSIQLRTTKSTARF